MLQKLILASALAVSLLTLAPQTYAQTAPVVVGDKAPDYSFTDIDGKKHSISGFKGKTVVLEWTNPGCPFVKKYYSKGDMQNLQAKATQNPDTIWVTINSSADGKQGHLDNAGFKKLIAENKSHSTAYVLDPQGTFGKLYGAKTTPHMFVINQKGILAYQGAIDSISSPDQSDIAKATPYVMNAIESVRKGEKLAVTTTPSYGCGVKYADDAPTADPTHKPLNKDGGKPVTSMPSGTDD
jgi:hypothetical protein